MPIRSVLAVDVDDDAFKAFHQTFLKYQTAVAKLPGQWKQVTTSAQGSKNIFVDMAAALMAQSELLRKSDQQMQRNRRTIDETQRSMRGLALSTKEFAGNLMSATSTLLKWTGVGGIVGSLAGILSLQGISRLAQSGSDQFRTSMGYAGPTTPGQVATASAYSSVGNPNQMLGQLTQMLQTAEGKQGLTALGIGPSEWGKGAGALLPKVMRELQRVSKNIPEQVLGDVLGGMGLGGFHQQASILKKMTPDQLGQLEAIQISQARQLNTTTTEMLLNWAKLNSMLEIASSKIQNAFIEALGPLVPTFSRVVDVFGNAVADFMKSDKVREWMENLATTIEKVDMDEFATKIKDGALELFDFAKNLGVVVKALAEFVVWIGRTIGKDDLGAKAGFVGGAAVGAAIGSVGGPAGALVGGVIGGVGGMYGGARASAGDPNRVVAEAGIPGAGGRFAGTGPAGVVGGGAGSWYTGSASASIAERGGGHNVGGIRHPQGGFRTYPNAYAGVADMGDLLKSYGARGFDTIDKIYNRWAPASDNNNTALLIKRAAEWTGFDANQKLDMSNPDTLRKIMIAQHRNEFGGKNIMDQQALDMYISGKGPSKPGGGGLANFSAQDIQGKRGNIAGTKFMLDQRMADRVNALIAGAPPELRAKLLAGITSAHRTHEKQAQIWEDSGHGTKYMAAAPGHSWHEQGEGFAVDWNKIGLTAGKQGMDYVRNNAGRHGLGFPLDPVKDPWHMQMSDLPINVTKVPGVRVTVTNDTGGNTVTAGSQVAQ